LLFVCRASSQRPTIERIQSHCRTQAMTCVSSHSPFYSAVPFILSKREVRLSRCGWRRFYLLIALVRARSTGGPFVLPLASLPMHTVSGASYFVATEKRSNDVDFNCVSFRVFSGENNGASITTITSNNDTSCNESPKEIGKTTLGEQVIPVLFPRVRVDAIGHTCA